VGNPADSGRWHCKYVCSCPVGEPTSKPVNGDLNLYRGGIWTNVIMPILDSMKEGLRSDTEKNMSRTGTLLFLGGIAPCTGLVPRINKKKN